MMQIADLSKREAGDWKSLRELFGAVERAAQLATAPIFAVGDFIPLIAKWYHNLPRNVHVLSCLQSS